MIDSDGDIEGARKLFTSKLEYPEARVLIMHPSIEAWLFPGDKEPLKHLREVIRAKGIRHKKNATEEQLKDVDIKKLGVVDETFREFISLIIE